MSDINDFINEIKGYSTGDIKLIITDQKDLYSPDELQALADELTRRKENIDDLCKDEIIGRMLAESAREKEIARLKKRQKEAEEREKARQQSEADRISALINQLKSEGNDGYWQYRVIGFFDENGGAVSTQKLANQLNELGLQGWKLACAYSNEIGHNSSSAGLMGVSAGTNSTVDQNVLIFEKYFKI